MAADRLKALQAIEKAQIRYQKLLDQQEKSGNDYTASLKKQNEKIKNLANGLKEINTSNQSFIGELEKGTQSIASHFNELSAAQMESVTTAKSMGSLNEAQQNAISTILEDTRSLSELSSDDAEQVAAKTESLKGQIDIAAAILGKDSEIVASMERQLNVASKIAKMSKKEKDTLANQISAFDTLNDISGGFLKTLEDVFQSTSAIVGSIIIGIGKVAGVLGETTREMGGFVGGLTGATSQVSLLSTIFPQALDTAKGLSSEFGGLSDLSFQTQLNTNLMATNMGISGTEAAALTGNFARLNGGSVETAQNLAESTKQLAIANGLMPSQVMADVAGSAKAFAEYGSDGGKNIGIAAVAAGKLGVNMATMTGVTDSLLDFESSITKELELGAMLGKNINLGKARQLAYEGKIGASVKEALKEMGGIESFNKMDIYQKRAAAAALGVSTEELQKMATNMDKLNDDGTMQLSTFESLNQTMKALASGPAATFLQTLGGGVIAIGQMGEGFSTLGKMFPNSAKALGGMWDGMKGMAGSAVEYVKSLFKAKTIQAATESGGIAKDVGGSIADKGKDLVTDKITDSAKDKGTDLVTDKITDVSVPDAPAVASGPSMGDKLKDLAGGLKEMGNAKVLFGALNLIPTGLGFLFMTPGIPGMMGTGKFAGKAGAGLLTLGMGLKAMGNAKVLFGAFNLIPAGIGFVAILAGLAGMAGVSSLGAGAGTGLVPLGLGLKAIGNASALFGALNLIPTGIGFLTILAGLPGMAGVSLLGTGAGVGLGSLATGLVAMAATYAGIGAVALAGVAFATLLLGIPGMLALSVAGPLAAAGIVPLVAGLEALGAAMLTGVGALGLAALIAAGIGLGITFMQIGVGAMMMGAGILLAAAGFAVLLSSMGSFMAGITLKQIGLIGLFSLSLFGLGTALLYLGVLGGMGVAVMMGIALATMLLGVAFNLLGTGIQSVGLGLSSIMTSLGGLVGIIGPISQLSFALLGLSGALFGLGLAMAFLGMAGLPGLLMLAGIAAISVPIIKLAGLFGVGGSGGESETSSLEEGSLSEYETNMLAKMDQLIQATSSQRDIYLDKDKVTNVVMDRGERSAVNKFSLNKA